MSLTTKDGTKLGQKIVTDIEISDVNANVATAPVAPRAVSPEMAILLNKSIVAKPIMAPEVCSLHIKDLGYRYRWVNKSAKNGLMYQMRRAQGFINATLDDVDLLGGDAVATAGEITAFDLVLMKCRPDIYDAALKFNMEKAYALQRARGVFMSGGSSDVNSDAVATRVSVAQEPFSRSGKAEAFIPANGEAIIDDSIRSGRVDKARTTVDELRSKAQKQE